MAWDGVGVCSHTRKPHKWKPLGKITTHTNGRAIDWHQCRGCGYIWGKDVEPADN